MYRSQFIVNATVDKFKSTKRCTQMFYRYTDHPGDVQIDMLERALQTSKQLLVRTARAASLQASLPAYLQHRAPAMSGS